MGCLVLALVALGSLFLCAQIEAVSTGPYSTQYVSAHAAYGAASPDAACAKEDDGNEDDGASASGALTVFPGKRLAETQPAKVAVEPMTSTLEAGDSFTVSVVISNAVNVGAFQFEMAYEPDVVHVDRAILGPFLGSSGRAALPAGPYIDNETGWMSFGGFSFGTQPGPDGGGVLAEVALTGEGAGSTLLDLGNVQVLDPTAAPQTVEVADGTASVSGQFFLPLVLRAE